LQFQIKGKDYFLAFVEDEKRWYVFSPTAQGINRIAVYIDAVKYEKPGLLEEGTRNFSSWHRAKGEAQMKRVNHPRATGGMALAQYGYKWARISAKLDVRRVAVQALTAMYGKDAARAAINEARRVSGKTRWSFQPFPLSRSKKSLARNLTNGNRNQKRLLRNPRGKKVRLGGWNPQGIS
jgi:hypothetical protein